MKIRLSGNFDTKVVHINNGWVDPRPSQDVFNHSPDGFNWGYGGSGPAQLALAVLLEVTDKEIALRNYQLFKREVVATLPQANFSVDIDLSKYLS